MLLAYLAMFGICGTKWPGWWRPGPRPGPGPDPEPWWDIGYIAIGAIGGIVAGEFFRPLIGDAGILATGATAFFGGSAAATVVGAVAGLAGGGKVRS